MTDGLPGETQASVTTITVGEGGFQFVTTAGRRLLSVDPAPDADGGTLLTLYDQDGFPALSLSARSQRSFVGMQSRDGVTTACLSAENGLSALYLLSDARPGVMLEAETEKSAVTVASPQTRGKAVLSADAGGGFSHLTDADGDSTVKMATDIMGGSLAVRAKNGLGGVVLATLKNGDGMTLVQSHDEKPLFVVPFQPKATREE